jgi:hypothetical protein
MSALYGRYHGRILSLARVSTADGAWRSKRREILAEFDKECLHLPRPRPPPCEMSWQLRSSTRFCVFQMPKEAMLALPQEGSTVEEISIGTHARTITPLAKCMIGLRRGQITCATTSNYPCEYPHKAYYGRHVGRPPARINYRPIYRGCQERHFRDNGGDNALPAVGKPAESLD